MTKPPLPPRRCIDTLVPSPTLGVVSVWAYAEEDMHAYADACAAAETAEFKALNVGLTTVNSEMMAENNKMQEELAECQDNIEVWYRRADKTWHEKQYTDEIAALRAELTSIARARPMEWEGVDRADCLQQFREWAQNRARAALEKKT